MRTSADLLLHPVRLRVVQALAGDRRLSAREIARDLADVPPATLYRHVNTLAEAGVIGVVEERPARGTAERVYALAEGAGLVSPQDLAAATTEDHVRYFTTFLAGLLGDFGRYVSGDEVDFLTDGATYSQLPLELTDQELAELAGRLYAALAPVIANKPGAGRRRRMLTTIVIPTPTDPPTKEHP